MPFSGGPRGCPGRYLAVTMLHTALASIVQRFEIESVPTAAEFSTATGVADEAERVRKFALWPRAGLPVTLRPLRGGVRASVAPTAAAAATTNRPTRPPRRSATPTRTQPAPAPTRTTGGPNKAWPRLRSGAAALMA